MRCLVFMSFLLSSFNLRAAVNPLAFTCATQVCGKAEEAPTAESFKIEALKKADKDVKIIGEFNKLKPLVNEVLKSEKVVTKLELERALEYVRKGEFKSDKQVNALEQLFVFLAYISKVHVEETDLSDINNFKLKVDWKTTFENLEPLQQSEKLRFQEFYEEMSKNPLFMDYLRFTIGGTRVYFRGAYPNKSYKEAVEIELELVKKLKKEIKTKNPLAYAIVSSANLDIMKDKELLEMFWESEQFQDELATDIFFTKLVAPFILDPKFKKFENMLTKDAKKFYSGHKDAIQKNIERKLEALKETDEYKAELERILLELEKNYRASQVVLPDVTNPPEVKAAKDVAKGLLESLKGKVTKKAHALIAKEMELLSFTVPMTKSSYRRAFEKILRDKILVSKSEVSDYEKFSASEKESFKILYLSQHLPVKEDIEVNKHKIDSLQEISKFQRSFDILDLHDSMHHLGNRNLYVSWQTIKSVKYGPGVIRHELGHLVESVILNNTLDKETADQFADLFQCLSDKHGDKKKAVEIQIKYADAGKLDAREVKIGWYAKEDFADYISAITAPKKESNMGCFLLETDETGKKYSESMMGLIRDEKELDTHSSELWRILHMELEKGLKFTKGCQDYIDAEKLKNEFISCKL